ncbi:LysR family transcriptional regulator [Marinobacter sp. BSs20148]|uniref:LysR family transcriptional regulator n=1 Tax=Marinobacter sp. BSs20148 TaxID=490759 RepID=UPI0002777406|nr:LysR family transcriptional regulator [Marinobacter sp. BSs20148]AFP32314.1 putative HTH-type transcriptional regulator ltrA [Marinobacter sp. BSs20148]
MDWKSITFDWNRARAFLVTAEEGSLAAAARSMGMTQPTLGRQVAALESEIGFDLFTRRGRGLELTPNGIKLLEHVRLMGDAANQFSLSASGKSDLIEGDVSITASELLSTFMLPPMIKALRELEPGIEIEIYSTNEQRDLNRREADIAIRSVRPTQPELIAKRLCSVRGHLYAAKSYLQQLGNPPSIAELNKANFIDTEKPGRLMTLLNSQGFSLTRQNFPVISNSHIVQWELVKQGMAISATVEEIGDNEPLVERVVISNLPLITMDLWLVTHNELRTNPRIRRVFDFMVSEFADY